MIVWLEINCIMITLPAQFLPWWFSAWLLLVSLSWLPVCCLSSTGAVEVFTSQTSVGWSEAVQSSLRCGCTLILPEEILICTQDKPVNMAAIA